MFSTNANNFQPSLLSHNLKIDPKVVRPTTLKSGLKKSPSSQHRAAMTPIAYSTHSSEPFLALVVTQRDSENVLAAEDSWGTYLSTLRQATVEAIRAKKQAQKDYLTVLVEADAWSKRLEIALNNECEDNARKALCLINVLRDMEHKLKALVEKHSVQVSTLKSQLAFWENQLTTYIDSPALAIRVRKES
jgi:hypothetical protein